MTEPERVALWDGRLDAKFNICYYRCLIAREKRRDQWLRFALFIFSSGTVAVLMFKAGPRWSAATSIFTLTVSALQSVLNPAVRVERLSTSFGRWVELSRRYDDLWTAMQGPSKLSDELFRLEMREIGKLEQGAEAGEAEVPDVQRIKDLCIEKVMTQEGLR